MFTANELSSVLLIDLETAPVVSDFSLLSAPMQAAWQHHARKLVNPDQKPAQELFLSHAALDAEFGRIVCLSAAYLNFTQENVPELVIRSLCGPDEAAILTGFAHILDKSKRLSRICAYNGREFDFPYLAKRFIIQSMALPDCFNCRDKNSWQLTHLLDPMQVWKFTVWKQYRSLDLLCAVLGIDSPKTQMNGSQVSQVFYQSSADKQVEYEQIARYCESDVIALARLMLRLSGLPTLTQDQISHRTNQYTFQANSEIAIQIQDNRI